VNIEIILGHTDISLRVVLYVNHSAKSNENNSISKGGFTKKIPVTAIRLKCH
jgi:hypothetical protein